MTDRITAKHLKRAAIVYVRQSSPEHVRNHGESTRIQIGLRDKAVAFGWRDPVTILDDLGTSAGGFAHRAGFQHMAAEVSLGHVGIILCFEASRLSRNSKDWAQLFEVCGHLDTLVADLDQIYDLAFPNDRLILGVKGSISEYELSLCGCAARRPHRPRRGCRSGFPSWLSLLWTSMPIWSMAGLSLLAPFLRR